MPRPDRIWRNEAEFSTAWGDLIVARDGTDRVLTAQLPAPPVREYTLESTGCYHLPVVRALGGIPHVLNPILAGATRSKTDRLDALQFDIVEAGRDSRG